MNILLVSYALGRTLGGIETHALVLAQKMLAYGHRITIACSKSGHESISRTLGIKTYGITIRNSADIQAIVSLVRMIRAEQIDVMIANSGREYWPCAVAAKLCRKRIIFIRHQTDRIRPTTRWLIAHHIEAVVAVSSAVRNALVRDGVMERKIVVIPNAYSRKRFHPDNIVSRDARRELGVLPTDMLIGTVVKLHSGKGIFQLLQAFACLVESYPNIKLLYVGDGPDREQLERMVRDQGLSDRVILAGRREDVERMYAAMDIFVLASTCDEAFGMVLIEAMAMRKPVIGTAVGGIPSIIEDGVSGLLIAPDSVAALAAALKRYLQDETFRKTIAHEGERMVTYRFSDQLFGERFHRLLTADGQDCPMNESSDNV